MKKRIFCLILALVMVLSLAACAGSGNDNTENTKDTTTNTEGSEATTPVSGGEAELALITDANSIDDRGFNQFSWEGLKQYAEENGKTYTYYTPIDQSTQSYLSAIEGAVNNGAKLIVTPGFLFGEAIYKAQTMYPDVHFVLVDATPTLDDDTVIADNTCSIFFAEEQSGFLAGYAAVKEGYRKLGFFGALAVPAVVRYGYGYVQGADAAAQELGTNIDINYFYGGQFYGDANITSRMEGWYSNGTQVVFACGGGIYTSAVEAALKNNGYVIGVDVDQNYIGANGVADGTYAYNPFITSAMKGLSEAVNTALADIDAGSWGDIAGSNGNFGLEDGDYIGLPTDADSWNFESFTTDEYEEVKGKIKSGEITVDNSSDDATKPTVSEFTTVNYIQ